MKKIKLAAALMLIAAFAVFLLTGCQKDKSEPTDPPVDYGELQAGKQILMINETGMAIIQLRLYSQKNQKWFTDVMEDDVWESGLSYELMLDAYENDVWKIEVTFTNGRLRTFEDLKLMELEKIVMGEKDYTAE